MTVRIIAEHCLQVIKVGFDDGGELVGDDDLNTLGFIVREEARFWNNALISWCELDYPHFLSFLRLAPPGLDFWSIGLTAPDCSQIAPESREGAISQVISQMK